MAISPEELPDLSALGLETTDAECVRKYDYLNALISRGYDPDRLEWHLLRDRGKLITALSEARGREEKAAEDLSFMRDSRDRGWKLAQERGFALEAAIAREATAREEERARAAAIAENPGFIQAHDDEWDEGVNYAKRLIAAAIRSRSNPGNTEDKSLATALSNALAENAELTRRAADAYMLARQPAPEPVDAGGNDDTMATLRRGLS